MLPEAHKKRIEQALTNFGNRQDWAAIQEQQYVDNRRVAKKAARVASNKLSEHECQVIVCHWLRAKGIPFFSIPNGVSFGGDGKARGRYMNYLKAEGLSNGVPDLICVGSPMVGVEMKRVSGGIVGPNQEAWHKVLRDNGWVVLVCEGDVDAIKQLGALYGN